jgi:hypothetical protein
MGLGKKVVKFLTALIAGVQVKFVEGQVILRNRKNGRYITISKRAYDSECVNKNNAYADFDVVPVSAENAHDVDSEQEVETKPKRKAKADNA